MSTKGGAGTQNVVQIPSIELDTSYTITGDEPTGAIYWDDENKTASIVLEGGVILQTGKETYFNVLNQTGDDWTNGQVISYAGAVGASGKIKGQLGLADGSQAYWKFLGLTTKDIANGESGEITILGAVRGVDTTGTAYGETWNEGDILYVSDTVAGGLTNVKPTGHNSIIGIGAVINVHAVNGAIGVRTTFIINTFGDEPNGNYSEFETDGSYHMLGDATVWNDVNIGGLTLKGPASRLPTLTEISDNTGAGTDIFTYGFDTNEEADGILEVPHSYKEGSDFHFHIHWSGNDAPSGTDYVRWELTYFISASGETIPPVTVQEVETAYDTQYERVNSDITIDGTDISMGDQFCFKLKRISSVGSPYSALALIQTVGIHFEEDTIGSRQITTK